MRLHVLNVLDGNYVQTIFDTVVYPTS